MAFWTRPDDREVEVNENCTTWKQLGMPIGLNKMAAERQRRYYEQAYGHCSRCGGKGFILKRKKYGERAT